MPCRPPRQRVLIAHHHSDTGTDTGTDISTGTGTGVGTGTDVVATGDNVSLASITTDVDLSDHPLGTCN